MFVTNRNTIVEQTLDRDQPAVSMLAVVTSRYNADGDVRGYQTSSL